MSYQSIVPNKKTRRAWANLGKTGSPSARNRVITELDVGAVPALTVGTEAGDVIELAVQMQDVDGNDVAGIKTVEVRLYAATMVESLSTAFRMADGGLGAMVTTTANAAGIFTTDANGALEIDITDVVGASGATIYAIVTLLGAMGRRATYTAVTFD